ncbi:hypothetical protein evm_014937 [Chilo suppressalis]|nr:hypothetical protein evm_014937 [Chilo suppressalis]
MVGTPRVLAGRGLQAQLTWGLQRGDTGGSPLPTPELLLLGNGDSSSPGGCSAGIRRAALSPRLTCCCWGVVRTPRVLAGRGLQAQLTWGLQRGDTGGNPLPAPDLLLLGNDGTKLAFGNSSHEQPGLLELSAPLLEDHWFSLEDPVVPVTRTQLMDVLADLKAVMIRAHYHYDQDEVRLESVSLGERVDGVQMERCSCAAGYEGQHCQRCAWTHARVARQCLPCACHGHATCVTVDGPCGECHHNTTGPHCERCLPGHYGNPVQAFPMDGIGRLGHDQPRGPSADWWLLTTADAAGTNGFTYLPKHGELEIVNFWSPIQ